eukprot:NODE_45_length_27728_cov_0.328387.p13 type:complete len:212 gc:universal NODE_45_length_27728_cov_0.328387:11206-11841(+)
MNRVGIGFVGAISLVEATKYANPNWSLYRTEWFKSINRAFRIHPTVLTLTGINVAVFAAWQYPPIRNTVSKYFTCSNISQFSAPKPYHFVGWLFSTCSHQSVIHLGCNMLAFQSFAPIILSQVDNYGFSEFFVTSAFLSSAASLLYKKRYGIVRSSVGLSGVLMAMLAFTALKYPHVKVNLMFIPIPFEIQSGMAAVVVMDVIGVIFRWQS